VVDVLNIYFCVLLAPFFLLGLVSLLSPDNVCRPSRAAGRSLRLVPATRAYRSMHTCAGSTMRVGKESTMRPKGIIDWPGRGAIHSAIVSAH